MTSDVVDDAMAEQVRLQKLLERQQRILMASKLMPELTAGSFARAGGGSGVASQALIEDVLNLSIFK